MADEDLGFEPDDDLGFEPDLRAENEARVRKSLYGPPHSQGSAAVSGLGNWSGAADEMTAGVGALYDRLQAKAGQRGDISFKDAYRTRIEPIHRADAQKAAQWPVTHGATQLGGTLAGAMVTPGINTVKGSAAFGGALAAGHSDARVEEEPGQLALETGFGAGIGAGSQAGFNKLAQTFSPANLREAATFRANKAATGEQMKDLRIQSKKAPRDEAGNVIPEVMRDPAEMIGGRLARRGEDMLQADEAGAPVVGIGDKWDDIFPRAAKKRDFFGQKLQETIAEADQAGVTIDGRIIAQRIMRLVDDIPEDSASRGKINAVVEVASEFERMGQIPFSRAQAHKKNYVYRPENTTPVAMGPQITNGVNRALSDAMEEAMAEAAKSTPGSRNFANYNRYKSKYDSYASISDASKEQSMRDLRRRFVSPSDYFSGGVGGGAIGLATAGATGSLGTAAVVGAVAAGGLGALNKIMRERGSATAARVAWRVYQAMDTLPTKYLNPLLDAAQKGGRQLELVDNLLTKHYPEYSAIMGGAAE